MQEELLNSVIKITKTRDVNSLEYSLVTTLQEFIQCQEIAVYKDLQDFGRKVIECSLVLHHENAGQYQWHDTHIVESPESELLSCLQSACIITVQNNNGIEHRWLPISIFDKPVVAIKVVSNHLSSSQQVLLNAFCRIYENYLTILHENERDKLTGLLNRQTFERKFKRLLEKQVMNQKAHNRDNNNRKRQPESYSWLAMVDIDHFKQVNDNYGHVCGDEVLLILAQQMRGFFRASDLMFRFGGEEFVLIFEPCKQEDINEKMQAFMGHVRNTHFPFVKTLTVSVGMARISPYDFPISVLENADKALYYAKNNGRDQLHFFDDLVQSGAISPDNANQDEGNIDLF